MLLRHKRYCLLLVLPWITMLSHSWLAQFSLDSNTAVFWFIISTPLQLNITYPTININYFLVIKVFFYYRTLYQSTHNSTLLIRILTLLNILPCRKHCLSISRSSSVPPVAAPPSSKQVSSRDRQGRRLSSVASIVQVLKKGHSLSLTSFPLFILDLQALKGPYYISLTKSQCCCKLLDLQSKQDIKPQAQMDSLFKTATLVLQVLELELNR